MIGSYAALFGWSFAAATILPLSSEVPLAYLVRAHGQLAWPVAVATAGNVLGAFTTYWLARVAGQAVRSRRASKVSPRHQRALDRVRRWGAPVLMLSWVPVLGDALVVAAGALKLPFPVTVPWIVIGKLARYAAVAWATLEMGS